MNSSQCFQSINIPNEWGFGLVLLKWRRKIWEVSNQLISPTSGDLLFNLFALFVFHVSNQLISPTSGDVTGQAKSLTNLASFQSINIPNEWGCSITLVYTLIRKNI